MRKLLGGKIGFGRDCPISEAITFLEESHRRTLLAMVKKGYAPKENLIIEWQQTFVKQ